MRNLLLSLALLCAVAFVASAFEPKDRDIMDRDLSPTEKHEMKKRWFGYGWGWPYYGLGYGGWGGYGGWWGKRDIDLKKKMMAERDDIIEREMPIETEHTHTKRAIADEEDEITARDDLETTKRNKRFWGWGLGWGGYGMGWPYYGGWGGYGGWWGKRDVDLKKKMMAERDDIIERELIHEKPMPIEHKLTRRSIGDEIETPARNKRWWGGWGLGGWGYGLGYGYGYPFYGGWWGKRDLDIDLKKKKMMAERDDILEREMPIETEHTHTKRSVPVEDDEITTRDDMETAKRNKRFWGWGLGYGGYGFGWPYYGGWGGYGGWWGKRDVDLKKKMMAERDDIIEREMIEEKPMPIEHKMTRRSIGDEIETPARNKRWWGGWGLGGWGYGLGYGYGYPFYGGWWGKRDVDVDLKKKMMMDRRAPVY